MTDGASLYLYGRDWRIIHQEKKHGAVKRTLECPLCRQLVDEVKVLNHLDRHDQTRVNKDKRAMGIPVKDRKPLPGQLGLPGFAKDVPMRKTRKA